MMCRLMSPIMTKVHYYSLLSPLHLVLLLPLFLSFPGGFGGGGGVKNFVAYAQSTSNINGVHTVYAGDQYADCTGLFCFSGPNWGSNGQFSWQVKVTFSQSAANYNGGSCFANPVEYYDWNKLWGKGRCGYTHNHQLDSDRFVWRRLQNLYTAAPNCGGVANCSGIQLGTYSYDNGVTPYPNENWELSKTFTTILQPDVGYILKMESYANGTVVHSISSSTNTLLESKSNVHSNLCTNYEQGAVLGLYFGGTCSAPQDITVKYETVSGPTNSPSATPTRSPSSTSSPTMQAVVTAKPTLKPTNTKSPTRKPTRKPQPTRRPR